MIRTVERKFYGFISLISIILMVLCLPNAFLQFGVLFFGVLAIACAGEWFALRVQATGTAAARRAGQIATIGRVLFIIFILVFAWMQLLIYQGSHADPEAEQADYILVLGAGLHGENPSAALRARLEVAKDFLQAHPDSTAVLCGGQGSNEVIPEARAMQKWLVKNGVASDRLLLEAVSSNTLQNIDYAKQLIEQHEPDGKYCTAVITNDFHLGRARRLMAQAGLDPYGLPATTPNAFFRTLMHIRESFSVFGLMLTGRW